MSVIPAFRRLSEFEANLRFCLKKPKVYFSQGICAHRSLLVPSPLLHSARHVWSNNHDTLEFLADLVHSYSLTLLPALSRRLRVERGGTGAVLQVHTDPGLLLGAGSAAQLPPLGDLLPL